MEPLQNFDVHLKTIQQDILNDVSFENILAEKIIYIHSGFDLTFIKILFIP